MSQSQSANPKTTVHLKDGDQNSCVLQVQFDHRVHHQLTVINKMCRDTQTKVDVMCQSLDSMAMDVKMINDKVNQTEQKNTQIEQKNNNAASSSAASVLTLKSNSKSSSTSIVPTKTKKKKKHNPTDIIDADDVLFDRSPDAKRLKKGKTPKTETT